MRWHICLAVSDTIGLGHLVRVQALLRSAELHVQDLWIWTDWPKERLLPLIPSRHHAFKSVSIDQKKWPGNASPEAILIDMPDPPHQLLEQTQSAQRKLLLGCSDYRQHWADLTVNVAEGDELDLPEPSINERCWKGARFALLREEFIKGRLQPYNSNGPILVAIGGTDPTGLSLSTVKVMLESQTLNEHSFELMISRNHRDYPAAEAISITNQRLTIFNFDPKLYERLQLAAAAVIAPGNLLFECLAIKAPAIAITQNKRQAHDFKSYPWLIPPENLSTVPNELTKLLSSDQEKWQSYANRTQSGQSVSKLIAWCNAPLAK